ncbi:Bacterial nucleoid DNA-binding protein [Candidatus Regiella insecticola 5.15]|uniref:Integration host factor subunit alpha n=1 Tax=Candidatus Regiella insecticola 5.15 TaxID=1005043 RepID=G2H0Q2_9ENTR|nr:integration host factor subunit alpha [Candidatus Regiella insecticola]EGY28423.1 Bacterial nucleoid DNA-binding protein [Candidatus Regiella insecticola 5.15]
MALTKDNIAENLTEKLGIDKPVAKQLVESFFEEIRLILKEERKLKVPKFGNFVVRNKPQRPGRNPKTGEDIPISARSVVTFKAGQRLKKQVENPSLE